MGDFEEVVDIASFEDGERFYQGQMPLVEALEVYDLLKEVMPSGYDLWLIRGLLIGALRLRSIVVCREKVTKNGAPGTEIVAIAIFYPTKNPFTRPGRPVKPDAAGQYLYCEWLWSRSGPLVLRDFLRYIMQVFPATEFLALNDGREKSRGLSFYGKVRVHALPRSRNGQPGPRDEAGPGDGSPPPKEPEKPVSKEPPAKVEPKRPPQPVPKVPPSRPLKDDAVWARAQARKAAREKKKQQAQPAGDTNG